VAHAGAAYPVALWHRSIWLTPAPPTQWPYGIDLSGSRQHRLPSGLPCSAKWGSGDLLLCHSCAEKVRVETVAVLPVSTTAWRLKNARAGFKAICTCVYVCMYACVYVCIYICIYIYMRTYINAISILNLSHRAQVQVQGLGACWLVCLLVISLCLPLLLSRLVTLNARNSIPITPI